MDPIDGFTFTHTGAQTEFWVLRPPMTQGRAFPAGCVLNDRLYCLGGQTLAGQITDCEVLDLPGTQVWGAIAPLPTARTQASATAVTGRVHIFGGYRTGVNLIADHDEYNPDTNQWTPRAPVLSPRSGTAAVTVNGRVFLIGGSIIANNVYTDIANVEEYNPDTNTWTPKAPMHTARSLLAAAVVDGKIYAIGGFGGVGADGAVEVYDPATDVWTVKPSILHPRNSAGAYGWNGKVYVVGGREGGNHVAETEEYDPVFNNWTTKMPMNILHYGFGYASIGPSCYSFGGITPGGQPGNYQAGDCHEYFAPTLFYPFRKN
ncbi:kelch-like protein [Patescibacteria group bacterium]|nr:MAG: kelch-like protein [Patescibacteria group bacterium]